MPCTSRWGLSFIFALFASGRLCEITASKGVDLDWHGFLEAGVRYRNKHHNSDLPDGDVYNDEYYQIGKTNIEAEIDFGKHLEARLDLRGDINDYSVVLRKAYIDMDLTDWLLLRVGNAKREFTLEEMVGRDELRTPNRSLANQYVESFHVLGYAFGIHARGRWGEKTIRRTTGWLGVSIDGAGRFVSIASAKHGVAENFAAVGSYLLLVRFATQANPIAVSNMAGAGWELDTPTMYAVAELAGGKDPNATDVKHRMGDTVNVLYGLVRTACFPFLELDGRLLSGLEPGLTTVYLIPDFSESKRGRVQVVPSCNLYLGRDGLVRLMVSADFLLHTDFSARELRKESYGATIQMQVAW
ncbi:MAG: hypothetical protein GF344_15970 [Chitinivibrionales bacterium]|nr:hypothetical protein [Chitinivibrionales bacterium]MBD3358192.1 hypothetical protein [Chitinivibrionales bacterium]